MKILLKNFGTYVEKEFDLPNNKFVLFKGENGSGKSTIFKAISWVLYSKHKTVRHGAKACEVVLQDSNWIVKRTSKPQTLKLRYKDEEYEGSGAQKLVYKLIGSNWDQFKLSTMIDSNTRSSLASITPGERFGVIRELVSTLDEPQRDLDRILAYEKSLNSDEDMTKGELGLLKKQLAKAQKELDNADKPEPVEVDEDERDELEDLLKKDRKKRAAWIDILSSGMTQEAAQERLDQLTLLPALNDKLSNMKTYLQHAKHAESIETTKREFEKGKKLHFKKLKKELADLNKAKLHQSEEDVLKVQARELSIRENARDDDNPYWDEAPEAICELLEEKKKEQKGSILKTTKQKCPHCEKFVAVDDTTVLKWKNAWGKSGDTSDIDQLETLSGLKQCADLDANDKWEKSVQTKMRLRELNRMIDGEILSSELIRMRKSFGEAIKEPSGYKQKYTVDYLEGRLEDLQRELGGIASEETGEREKLESMLSSKILPTKKKLDKLNARIEETEARLDEFRQFEKQLADIKEYSRLKKFVKTTKKAIQKIDTNVADQENIRVAIQKLKVLQKEAEIMSMQNVVDTINVYSSDYLQRFFDEAINVELTLIKKTQKGVKLSLDIDIEYNGQKYDIGEFSQGELIKINLAFILSMNRLQNSRYLFLDEVLQNLDKNVLLEIYECLKSINEEVSVFVIDHNSVEGFFDEVIEFKK